jgi:hypothetical protein
MLKKVSIKLLSLLILILIINVIYVNWFHEKDIIKHSGIIKLVRDIPVDADIIYVGESSNITYHGNDIDTRPISGFIGDYFPNLTTSDITKPAGHSGIFKVLLKEIPPYNKVSTVIVTLNLRSFNAQWIYSDLETSLQKNLVLLKNYPPIINRFLLSFKSYDIKSAHERERQVKVKWKRDKFHFNYDFPYDNVMEWDNSMAKSGIKDSLGNVDYKLTELACHYIKSYAFQIDTNSNPRIRDFDEIISLANERGWNLVFNLLAENTQKARQLVGDDLVRIMENNAMLLKDYFENKGVVVVNNLKQIPNNQFIDQDWTTEHYNETGRKTIAANVANTLKGWYNNDYINADHNAEYHTTFFNNCDNGLNWGQPNTISNLQAYSGENSSLTHGSSDYGITMEYPLSKIPDSLKNNISVSFMYYYNSKITDSKLVIQATGEEMENYWNGVALSGDKNFANRWHEFNYTMDIPLEIKETGVLKIYVYNPTSDTIFVDDFMITFE